MNLFTLTAVEFKKIKRSKIVLILIAATVILWFPNVLNADLNFDMNDIGISRRTASSSRASWEWHGSSIRRSWS